MFESNGPGCWVEESKGDRWKLFRLCYPKTRKPRALKLQFTELRSRQAAVAPNHSKTWDPKPLGTQEWLQSPLPAVKFLHFASLFSSVPSVFSLFNDWFSCLLFGNSHEKYFSGLSQPTPWSNYRKFFHPPKHKECRSLTSTHSVRTGTSCTVRCAHRELMGAATCLGLAWARGHLVVVSSWCRDSCRCSVFGFWRAERVKVKLDSRHSLKEKLSTP